MRQIYKSPMTFANIFTKVVGLLLFLGWFWGGKVVFPNISGVHTPDFYITSFQDLVSEELCY